MAGVQGPTDLWDAAGKRLHLLELPEGCPGLAFSPDGCTLATPQEGGLILWEVPSGARAGGRRGVIRTKGRSVWALTFSPDGKTLAAGDLGGLVRLWDVASGADRGLFEGHTEIILCLAFSPDGRTLASGSADGVRLWDVTKKRPLAHLPPTGGTVAEVSFSPDGKMLASAGDDGTVRLWETATGEERAVLRGHSGSVTTVAFRPGGRLLASGSYDTTILVWDLAASTPATVGDDKVLWADLTGGNAARAFRACCTLSRDPRRAISLIEERLGPVPAPDARELARLVADLDSDQFESRERASRQLEKLGRLPELALRRLAERPPSAEAHRRALHLLEKTEAAHPSGECLAALRATEVLERLGTPDARQLLGKLAAGAEGAWLTAEARAALRRLDGLPRIR